MKEKITKNKIKIKKRYLRMIKLNEINFYLSLI